MAGKKGKSGRKPNTDGKKMRAVNLYIPMYEYDVSHFNSKGIKMEWIPESWFRQFKRIYGSRWQEKVRSGIQFMVREYEERHMWKCKCSGRMKSTHFKHESICPRCEYEPYDLQRYKTKALARVYSKEDPRQRALTLCPSCKEPLSLEIDVHGRKVMSCRKCK